MELLVLPVELSYSKEKVLQDLLSIWDWLADREQKPPLAAPSSLETH